MHKKIIRITAALTLSVCMLMGTGCGSRTARLSVADTTMDGTAASSNGEEDTAYSEDTASDGTQENTVSGTADEETTAPEDIIIEADGCEWAETTVFYEIFVRSFADGNGDGIGDFKGITDKAEYLKTLGVGAVWLMPVMESTTYHGYDVVDYYTPNPDYGTMEEFEEMVETLHELGIKVIIDFVVNHTSSSNKWFIDAMNDENSPYRDFYLIEKEIPVEKDDASYSEWRYNKKTEQYYYAHYDTIMPDLNYSNDEVRKEIINVAKYWLDHGVDGFRLDGAKEIDSDINITLDWWSEFSTAVKETKKDAFIVGENWTYDKEELSCYYSAMMSSFNFIAADDIIGMAKGRAIDIVAEINEMRELFKAKAEADDSVTDLMIDSVMIGNHDMDRVMSRVEDIESAKLAATIQMTLPGTPFIYYGEEIGQIGQKPDDDRREPFEWYASAEGDYMTTKEKFFVSKLKYVKPYDGISVEEEEVEEDSIFMHYINLLNIRNNNKTFFNGTYETIGVYDNMYAYIVYDSDNRYLVVHNLSNDDKTFNINVSGTDIYSRVEVSEGEYHLAEKNSLIMKYTSDSAPLDEEQFAEIEETDYQVTFRLTVPENTPDEPIYIIGTFDGWKVADEPYIMTKVDEYTYEYVLTGTAMSSIEYKYNRGTWSAREQNSEHQDLVGPLQKENREYVFEEDNYIVEDVIESWSDIRE